MKVATALSVPDSGSSEVVTKRPTLPIGYSLAGLAPVTKVLHSDERSECYGLVSSDITQTVLLLVKQRGGAQYDTPVLPDWWAAQSPEILTVRQVLSAEQSPASFTAAVLSLRGCCIEGEPFTDAKEERLKRLFRAMLDVVDRGMSVRMFPDFNPALTWLAVDETAMCTLLAVDGPLPAESEQVRLVAKAFYCFATGIQSDLQAGRMPALLRWSKFAGEELSRIVDRCLMPANPKVSITTFAGLNNTLGRERIARLKADESGAQMCSSPVPSGVGQGLDKVAGMHALKELLHREVVAPIRNPEPHRRYGLSIPNGILLYGPPGCGKTYIARQLAEELGHYFVEIIPSELASPYVHQSVLHIRELFDTAAEQAPAVMFIDEFEALVPSRGQLGGHQHYKAEEVNEFLAHLNGCSEKNIFVIAATNEPEKIDPAVRRTGRLDKLIYVGPPDTEARREMLILHLEGRPVASDVDLRVLADALECYSASDIRFLVDEAARDALKKARDITNESFCSAMSRIRPSVPPEIQAQYQSIEQRGF